MELGAKYRKNYQPQDYHSALSVQGIFGTLNWDGGLLFFIWQCIYWTTLRSQKIDFDLQMTSKYPKWTSGWHHILSFRPDYCSVPQLIHFDLLMTSNYRKMTSRNDTLNLAARSDFCSVPQLIQSTTLSSQKIALWLLPWPQIDLKSHEIDVKVYFCTINWVLSWFSR